MPVSATELAQLRAALDRQALAAEATRDQVASTLRSRVLSERDWYSTKAQQAMRADLVRVVGAGQTAASLQLDAYLARTGSIITGDVVQPIGVTPRAARTWRTGDLTHEDVYDRIGAEYRYRRSQGQSERDARAAVANRAIAMGHTDIGLAARGHTDEFVRGRKRYKFAYRRVVRPELTQGNTCMLCIVASDRIYYRGDLMPIHSGCVCGVMLVTPSSDPGALLNRQELDAIYDEAGGTGYAALRRVKVNVEEHGELGPVLTNRAHHFRGPAEVAASAAENATKSAVKPDPLAELDLDDMSDGELDDLMMDLAGRGEWQASERVGEYLDARSPVETAWKPDPDDAFNDQTFEWFETLTDEEQWAFTDQLGERMSDYFYEEQWAWSAGKKARVNLTPERQIREMWDTQLDIELAKLENATNGFTLTPKAVAEGRTPRDLFHANDQTAYAWASEETKRHWEATGGRPTWGRFKALANGGEGASDARYAMARGADF